MVFLGGAVLANLVRGFLIHSYLNQLTQHLDCRQGRHVGIQAGVAGTRRTRSGKTRPAISGCISGHLITLFSILICSSSSSALSASRVRFYCDILSTCRYPSINPLFPFTASYIVPRPVWCGCRAVDNEKKVTFYDPCSIRLLGSMSCGVVIFSKRSVPLTQYVYLSTIVDTLQNGYRICEVSLAEIKANPQSIL